MNSPPEGSDIAALLNIFQYLDLEPKINIGQNLTMEKILGENDYFATFTPEQERMHAKLLAACAANPDFANIMLLGESVKLTDPRTGEPFPSGGLKAGFYGDLRTGTVYTAFRGTGGGEWLDNALAGGGLMPFSPQQEEALAFFDFYIEGAAAKMRELSGQEPGVIVTGHSKGGNKAQFIAMMTEHQDIVRAGISMDGQGMSPEAMGHMIDALGAENFDKIRTEKLASVCGENDFVHPFYHNMGSCVHEGRRLPSALIPPENTVYLKMDAGFGPSLRSLHVPDSYVTEAGRLTAVTEKGALVKVLENISDAVMNFPPPARALITESVMWAAQFARREAPLGGQKVDPARFTAGLNLFVFSLSAGLLDSLSALMLEVAQKAARAVAALVAGVMTRTGELITEAGKLGAEIKEMGRQSPELAGAEQLGTALTEAAAAEIARLPRAEMAETEMAKAQAQTQTGQAQTETTQAEQAPAKEARTPDGPRAAKPFAAMSFAERVEWAKERSGQSESRTPNAPAPPGRVASREL
ncbi:MAG: DUF2974 domain-containing protein [Gracilibacteraceae bacterium]|jgi:hypothetical protein|nr:DUF2974 domain-containing protein [Gracilibacteraceae bacterium]